MPNAMPLKPATDNSGQYRWLITFADLIALLLAFFVMLFSMKVVDPEPWENMTNSLIARLNPDFAWESLATLSDLDATSIPAKDAADLDYLKAVLTEKIRNDPLLSQALFTRRNDRLIISLQADSLFSTGSASLGEDARAALYAMGDTLRHISNRVEVNGHTDPAPVHSERYVSNWELSVYRALAVADALVSAGYTQEIVAIGFAESRYAELAAVSDPVTRARRARRVDVVIRETEATEGDYGE